MRGLSASLSGLGYATASELVASVMSDLSAAAADGTLVNALHAECGCDMAVSSVGATADGVYPTLSPTPAPTSPPSAMPFPAPSRQPTPLPTPQPTPCGNGNEDAFVVTSPGIGVVVATGQVIEVRWNYKACTSSHVDIKVCAYLSGGGERCFVGEEEEVAEASTTTTITTPSSSSSLETMATDNPFLSTSTYEVNDGAYDLTILRNLPTGAASIRVVVSDDIHPQLKGVSLLLSPVTPHRSSHAASPRHRGRQRRRRTPRNNGRTRMKIVVHVG